ncbi:MAG: D-aminoacyl-tRNA deacylase [Deferribacterales bacterium]
MKAVIQRVNSSYLKIDGVMRAETGRGLVVLFGVEKGDRSDFCAHVAHKTVNLRIFEDENGKMGRSVKDIDGEMLIVSQFTLAGTCNKGLRPDFTSAMEPVTAKEYYEIFISECEKLLGKDRVKTGVFAADMKVGLENDGPVTIIMEKTE